MNQVLIYKQTHSIDPGYDGVWGESGCMGEVRGNSFDAIIGIGGNSKATEPAIAGKLTWAALRPHQIGVHQDGYPIWCFDRFLLLGSRGNLLEDDFPAIACLTEGHFRHSIEDILTSPARWEIKRIWVIVELAKRSERSTPKKGKVC